MKKLTKRILSAGLVGMMTLAMAGCGNSAPNGQVVVYNWGEFIDPQVNKMFTQETGIKVVYSEYANNEEMYAKVEPGNVSYDVIFHQIYG